MALAGCGGGGERQDANEPEGDYEVELTDQSFPAKQKLAKPSQLRIEVKNADTRTIPNVAVTVKGFDFKLRDPVDPKRIDPSQADPERPQFVVDKGPIEFLRDRSAETPSLVDKEVDPPAPEAHSPAFVDTYTLGPLPPGETAVFRWNVTAVVAGPYEISYAVEAGTDGRANAVGIGGESPTGTFEGEVSDAPVKAEIAKDGRTVITEGRKRRGGGGY